MFRETPITRAITLTGIFSARCTLRISAQSSGTGRIGNRWIYPGSPVCCLPGGLSEPAKGCGVTFGNYARAWLRDHPKVGPRYQETCERNLRLHLAPLNDVPLRAAKILIQPRTT